jgi:hypothetical protein
MIVSTNLLHNPLHPIIPESTNRRFDRHQGRWFNMLIQSEVFGPLRELVCSDNVNWMGEGVPKGIEVAESSINRSWGSLGGAEHSFEVLE